MKPLKRIIPTLLVLTATVAQAQGPAQKLTDEYGEEYTSIPLKNVDAGSLNFDLAEVYYEDEEHYLSMRIQAENPARAKLLTTPVERKSPTEREKQLFQYLKKFDETYQEFSCVDYAISIGRLTPSVLPAGGTSEVVTKQTVPTGLDAFIDMPVSQQLINETLSEDQEYYGIETVDSSLACYNVLDANHYLGWFGANNYYKLDRDYVFYEFEQGNSDFLLDADHLFQDLKAKLPAEVHPRLEEIRAYIIEYINR
ncbi:hypothetical protein [Endozoicomonas arenosclerae]|uniref:hypothetical protein n=1 Tax=Endozoicomonas arenosclerae TaxID=1633495 RepID=UPI000A7B4E0C|nr:hypothetical protein [Endozoicomonas arenosclerae]